MNLTRTTDKNLTQAHSPLLLLLPLVLFCPVVLCAGVTHFGDARNLQALVCAEGRDLTTTELILSKRIAGTREQVGLSRQQISVSAPTLSSQVQSDAHGKSYFTLCVTLSQKDSATAAQSEGAPATSASPQNAERDQEPGFQQAASVTKFFN